MTRLSRDAFWEAWDAQNKSDAEVMVAMQWSWRDLCECPEDVLERVITRLQSERK